MDIVLEDSGVYIIHVTTTNNLEYSKKMIIVK